MEDANEQVNRNELNIEALADQVYGLDILTSTTGQLSAASSELSSVASSKQLENFENFNNMMVCTYFCLIIHSSDNSINRIGILRMLSTPCT